jgi:hypothetical protein
MSPAGKKGGAPREIAIRYRQTGEGVPEGGKEGVLSTRDGTLDPKMFLTCANPACKKGGFSLRAAIDRIVAAEKTEAALALDCAGYVGALRTEKGPAKGCGNKLEVSVTVTWPKPR